MEQLTNQAAQRHDPIAGLLATVLSDMQDAVTCIGDSANKVRGNLEGKPHDEFRLSCAAAREKTGIWKHEFQVLKLLDTVQQRSREPLRMYGSACPPGRSEPPG
ncbi:MAG TPA: hypothetical protein VMP01_23800 [Pirellulaceae bacterium]|nr:hypothetical protein [Pirellulaceae bacterium]